MTRFRPLLAKELVEAWRTYRLGIVGGLFLVLGILSPVVTRYLPEIIRAFAPPGFEIGLPTPGLTDAIDQLLKNVGQFGALAAILVTMGSVAGEKERGTAALVLAKPVSRSAFLWAKFVALGVIFAVATSLAVASAWLYTAWLFESPPVLAWIELALVVWLSTMVYVSITFLGSTVARSPLGAAAVGFGGLIGLSLASVVPTLTSWLPAGLFGVAKALALGVAAPEVDPPRTIAVSFGLIAACFGLAWWRFRRAEL
jgi:ABC-2 type transport system permease protein